MSITAIKPKPRPTTLAIGERVAIRLIGRGIERVNGWGGVVVGVDSVAVRLRADWYRFALSTCPTADGRIVIVPWRQIQDIKIEEPAVGQEVA